MDNLKMVEDLVRKSDASYAEAKEALEITNWNMLDAVVCLENRGKKIKGSRCRAVLSGLWEITESVISLILATSVNVFRDGTKKFSVPLIIALIFAEVLLPIAIIALFFGYTYSVGSRSAQTEVFTAQNAQVQNTNGSFGFNVNPER